MAPRPSLPLSGKVPSKARRMWLPGVSRGYNKSVLKSGIRRISSLNYPSERKFGQPTKMNALSAQPLLKKSGG